MKNKIYPILLGLSCIMIVALVSFKNSEKAVEKEQMVITVNAGMNKYFIYVQTANKMEKLTIELGKEEFNIKALLSKIQEYSKEGWEVSSSSSGGQGGWLYTYMLEREVK